MKIDKKYIFIIIIYVLLIFISVYFGFIYKFNATNCRVNSIKDNKLYIKCEDKHDDFKEYEINKPPIIKYNIGDEIPVKIENKKASITIDSRLFTGLLFCLLAAPFVLSFVIGIAINAFIEMHKNKRDGKIIKLISSIVYVFSLISFFGIVYAIVIQKEVLLNAFIILFGISFFGAIALEIVKIIKRAKH